MKINIIKLNCAITIEISIHEPLDCNIPNFPYCYIFNKITGTLYEYDCDFLIWRKVKLDKFPFYLKIQKEDKNTYDFLCLSGFNEENVVKCYNFFNLQDIFNYTNGDIIIESSTSKVYKFNGNCFLFECEIKNNEFSSIQNLEYKFESDFKVFEFIKNINGHVTEDSGDEMICFEPIKCNEILLKGDNYSLDIYIYGEGTLEDKEFIYCKKINSSIYSNFTYIENSSLDDFQDIQSANINLFVDFGLNFFQIDDVFFKFKPFLSLFSQDDEKIISEWKIKIHLLK